MRALVLFLAVLLVGCGSSSKVHRLDERWHPLEEIREGDLPVVSDTAATTIGRTVYTADLSAWLAKHPPDGPDFAAVLATRPVGS